MYTHALVVLMHNGTHSSMRCHSSRSRPHRYSRSYQWCSHSKRSRHSQKCPNHTRQCLEVDEKNNGKSHSNQVGYFSINYTSAVVNSVSKVTNTACTLETTNVVRTVCVYMAIIGTFITLIDICNGRNVTNS